MPKVAHSAAIPQAPRQLIVFLPGFLDGPEHFVKYGFVEIARRFNPHADVLAADAHFAYYRTRSVITRLEEDVIGPAKAAGYEEIWLVGISMGGFGALIYAIAHPERITGVLALAPYLGEEDVIEEVMKAGGLKAWKGPPAAPVEDDTLRKSYELWGWLKGYAHQEKRPRLLLGYGDQDKVRTPAALIREVLPKAQVQVRPGGHKWVVWKPLFERFAKDQLVFSSSTAISRARATPPEGASSEAAPRGLEGQP